MMRSARSSRFRDDRGSATAETAIVLPVVVVMTVLILIVGSGLSIQVRLESAARAAAREIARGEEPSTAVDTARRIAGTGTDVSVTTAAGWTQVTVVRELRIASGPLAGGRWRLSADASARLEPQLLDASAPVSAQRIGPGASPGTGPGPAQGAGQAEEAP